ncbi:hypothetical protein [Streptomyces clavuligerus]|uniref:Uncharacterized protein n=1 Tax=Streptomyces clavuligerus TaxID=1901 RepID=E2Q6C8_STRCL|nr:hypothetical protein [Streptomyces clavuligerus]ANW19878.1 hypothetical protein BB341_17455 [Streptomyces clavuligerus]AXU14496.1 hypothetical protein D1794_18225 [Streptomyces clavuligerus]EFG07252.1 Hypothetical protein SCLAV_2179 [Streptomyces clavuligerus]MBY6304508.1 hypothetical protein [Streptomyces clavuligerus]QCS07270.1 hypothetical protein CRV15_17580 [Streptomyces clavuligerus]
MQCPECGGDALPDPEGPRVIRCMSCWHAWAVPQPASCPGLMRRFLPALRAAARAVRPSR